MYIIDETRTFS